MWESEEGQLWCLEGGDLYLEFVLLGCYGRWSSVVWFSQGVC